MICLNKLTCSPRCEGGAALAEFAICVDSGQVFLTVCWDIPTCDSVRSSSSLCACVCVCEEEDMCPSHLHALITPR